MLHPSTKKLVDRLSEMTAQRKVAWTEGDNGAIQFETEGYRVVVHADPQSLTLETVEGKVMEEVSAEQLAETPCEDGGSYQTVIADMVKEASRTARGTETAIERLLSGLDRALEPVEQPAPVVAAAADPALTAPGVADTAPGLDEDPVEETGAVTAEIRPEGALAADTDQDAAEETGSQADLETPPDVTPEPVAAEAVEDTAHVTPAMPVADPVAPAADDDGADDDGARFDLSDEALSTARSEPQAPAFETDPTEAESSAPETMDGPAATLAETPDTDEADDNDASPLSDRVAAMGGPATGFAPDAEPMVAETAEDAPEAALGFADASGLGAPQSVEVEPDPETNLAVEDAAVDTPPLTEAAPLPDMPEEVVAEPDASEPTVSVSHASPWAAANPAFGAPAASAQTEPAPEDTATAETEAPTDDPAPHSQAETETDAGTDGSQAEASESGDGDVQDDEPAEQPAPVTRFNPWN